MSENTNMDGINNISSAVSERTKKIWENAAYISCINKETEKLKIETAQLIAVTAEKEKENKVLEQQIMELDQTLETQRQILQTSQQSAIMQNYMKESVVQEANDFKKKYAEMLEKYNEELKAHRARYENASQSYKDLRALQIKIRKLNYEKMRVESDIADLKESQKQYEDIQKLRFQKMVVKFAQFYIDYHEREKLNLQIEEMKKEEEHLLREHLQLSETVKQKRMEQNRAQTAVRSSVNENKPPQIPSLPIAKESNELTNDKLRKFLDEEFIPCSLTTFSPNETVLHFNQDNSKVKVLEVKTITPPSFKPAVEKPNLDLRKKMQRIVETAKKEAFRSSSSLQFSPSGSQKSQTKPVPTPSGSQQDLQSQQSKRIETLKDSPAPTPTVPKSGPKTTSRPTTTVQKSEPSQMKPKTTSRGSSQIEKLSASKETVTTSILKPASQTITEKNETNKAADNVSKFFTSKKKPVTFQHPQEETNTFQLFRDENKAEIFQNTSYLFKDDDKNQQISESENDITNMTNNVSFMLETGPTFGTFGDPAGIKNPEEMSFELDNMNRSFGQSGLKPAPTTENPTFSFFGTQTESKNPFGFF